MLLLQGESRNGPSSDVSERGGLAMVVSAVQKNASLIVPGAESALGVTSASWAATWSL